jgi:micrococcal nuclease
MEIQMDNKFGDKIVFDEDLAKEKKPSDLAIIAFLCLLSTNAMAENVQEVTIVKISDGDTIRAMVDGKNESIRLLDIDCFETSKNKRAVWQSEYYHLPMGKVLQNGMFSKDKLTDLLKNQKTITLKWSKRDKYKRILGHLFLPEGTNINQYMLEQGGCVEYIDRHK